MLDEATYEKGIKVSDEEMDSINMTGDEFHPEWNYTIMPRRERIAERLCLSASLVGYGLYRAIKGGRR